MPKPPPTSGAMTRMSCSPRPKRVGESRAQQVRHLRGRVQRQDAGGGVIVGDAGAALQGEPRVAVRAVRALPDEIGLREGAVDVAQASPADRGRGYRPRPRAPAGRPVRRPASRSTTTGSGVIIHLDELRRVLGDVAIDAPPRWPRPGPQNARAARRAPETSVPFHPGHSESPRIGRASRAASSPVRTPDHAVEPCSAIGAHGPDLRMGIGAPHEGGVHGAGQPDVVDVARAPVRKREVLAAGDALPDLLGRPQAHWAPPLPAWPGPRPGSTSRCGRSPCTGRCSRQSPRGPRISDRIGDCCSSNS